MIYPSQLSLALLLFIAPFALLDPPAAAQNTPPWGPEGGPIVLAPVDSPPSRLWGERKRFYREWVAPSPHQKGTLWYDTSAMHIRVDWYASQFINTQAAPTQQGNWEIQTFALPFYPTGVVWVDDRNLVVAGKGRGNTTIVEHWTLKWPNVMPVPEFGSTKVQIALPRVLSKKEVLRTDVPGRRLVNKLSRIRGATDAVLIQFDDSRDLVRLELTSGVITPIASVGSSSPLGATPQLADEHQFIWTGDHQQFGDIYVFGSHPQRPILFPRPDVLVLYDQDRDGSFDGSLAVPVEAWDQSVFADHTQFNDVDG